MDKFTCPCCGQDITDFFKEQMLKEIRKNNLADARKRITPEKRAEMNKESAIRLNEWRKSHPEQNRKNARKASSFRTKETFRKQAETVKNTMIRKTVVFAELLNAEMQKGTQITPEIEYALMQKSAEIVKQENKEKKKELKKLKVQKP